MKRILILLFICFTCNATQYQVSAQLFGSDNSDSSSISNGDLQLLYSADPNHREIVLKSFELALSAGFFDTSGITLQEIRDRLEAGAYSEDFEEIPGIVGEHFPAPWNQGPDFNFYGLYSFSKIPYGSYTDTLCGWYRGLNHGYDPVQKFIWPGAYATTVDWANSPVNSFIWGNVINLYSSGNEAKAYECLGHLLHLLADLSIPSHAKVVDHGIGINSINAGTPLDPDLLELIVDEYELSLAGGIPLPGVIFIPNLLNDFQSALNLSSVNNIPVLGNWDNYFVELGQYTYNHLIVNQYYEAPVQNGEWGSALNENGTPTNPAQYGITPPVQLNGRWVQVTFKSTAGPNGTIIPESKMLEMCNDLVPKAIEYSAGLLMYFDNLITDVIDNQILLENFSLYQNYPNPFNPNTTISWQIPVGSQQTLKIYDVLGNEVATLINEYKPGGTYEVEWDARGLPSGIYFYQLKSGVFVDTKKMILIK